jgi:hypothetical protein
MVPLKMKNCSRDYAIKIDSLPLKGEGVSMPI